MSSHLDNPAATTVNGVLRYPLGRSRRAAKKAGPAARPRPPASVRSAASSRGLGRELRQKDASFPTGSLWRRVATENDTDKAAATREATVRVDTVSPVGEETRTGAGAVDEATIAELDLELEGRHGKTGCDLRERDSILRQ